MLDMDCAVEVDRSVVNVINRARVGECSAQFWSGRSLSNYYMARRRGCCRLSLSLADCTFLLENRDSCIFELLDCFLAPFVKYKHIYNTTARFMCSMS